MVLLKPTHISTALSLLYYYLWRFNEPNLIVVSNRANITIYNKDCKPTIGDVVGWCFGKQPLAKQDLKD